VKAFITTMMDAGRARRTVVELGRQTGQSAEVTAGLAEGTRVILHPGDTLVDGARSAGMASSELSHSWRSQGLYGRCARRQDLWIVTGGSMRVPFTQQQFL